jgi:hypothetical protein
MPIRLLLLLTFLLTSLLGCAKSQPSAGITDVYRTDSELRLLVDTGQYQGEGRYAWDRNQWLVIFDITPGTSASAHTHPKVIGPLWTASRKIDIGSSLVSLTYFSSYLQFEPGGIVAKRELEAYSHGDDRRTGYRRLILDPQPHWVWPVSARSTADPVHKFTSTYSDDYRIRTDFLPIDSVRYLYLSDGPRLQFVPQGTPHRKTLELDKPQGNYDFSHPYPFFTRDTASGTQAVLVFWAVSPASSSAAPQATRLPPSALILLWYPNTGQAESFTLTIDDLFELTPQGKFAPKHLTPIH